MALMSISSDLTIFEVSEWKQSLLGRLSAHDSVTLDLTNAGKVDASGFQLIMAAHRAGKLILHNIPPATAEDLRRLGWEPGKQGA